MQEMIDKVFQFLLSVEGSAAVIGIVVEAVFRLIPTKKPLSILWVVVSVIEKLGALLIKVSQVLDKVLPQKVKPE